jgi:hypothetical protein
MIVQIDHLQCKNCKAAAVDSLCNPQAFGYPMASDPISSKRIP